MENRQPTPSSQSSSPAGSPTLAEVAFQETQRLTNDPNICAVGYGLKRSNEVVETAASLVFLVREKLRTTDEFAARGTWPIPTVIHGFRTDVVEVGNLKAAAADRAVPTGRRGTLVEAPLSGGLSTMGLGDRLPGPGGYGTIGGLCFDTATGEPLLLSNAHVWGPPDTEVTQPVIATSLFGAGVAPATFGTNPEMVLTRVSDALVPTIVFANSITQAYLVTGSDTDPQAFGQEGTVPGEARTDREEVSITAEKVGFLPAGRRLVSAPSWRYERFTSKATLPVSSNSARSPTKLLAARRLFTNAVTYSISGTVNLYAEIIPAAGGLPLEAPLHFPLVLLYPLPGAAMVIPRLLRPTTRQTPTTVTTGFTGFPAPARLGAVALPFSVSSGFTIDSLGTGTFENPSAGTLPTGTFALKLPVGMVRLFVPPSTEVTIDIDLSGLQGALVAKGVNSAGEDVGVTNVPSPGPSGRTQVSVTASEIVEVRLTVVGAAVLYGLTAKRASLETTSPLTFAGSIPASVLGSGQWGASLFVQSVETGVTQSANVVETAIGLATLLRDCTFQVN